MRRGAVITSLAASLLALLGGGVWFASPASAALTFSACPSAPSIGCGRLAVPLDPADPAGAQITLAVRRLLAGATPSEDAVVGLAGGPGQAAVPLTSSFALEMAPALQTRDLIVFDQRGTGLSAPLQCPALQLTAPVTADSALCASEIGPRRGNFTTADTVADIEALRVAGGYRKLVLFGTSYGTKVALAYAEQYPQNVEALVLDSTVLPDGPDVLQRSSFAEIPVALRDLCSGSLCAPISANPLADIARLVGRIDRTPLRASIYNGRGRRVTGVINGAGLLDLLIAGDLNPALRAELPAAVHGALHHDGASLLRLAALSQGYLPDAARPRAPVTRQAGGSDFNQALYLTTSCEESLFPWSPRNAPPASRHAQALAALSALPASALYPFDRVSDYATGNIPTCLSWPVASPPPPAASPLPDVPTLILSGEDDMRTPTADARLVAAQIPDAQLVVVPHTGHSVLGADLSDCSAGAVRAFFALRPVTPCANVPNDFRPTPVPPTSLSDVTPPPGLGGQAGRTLAAVQATLVDLRREIIGAILNADAALPSGSRFGGLRGGDAALTPDTVVLHSFAYVSGVTLTAAVPIPLLTRGVGAPARIRVGGSAAADGTVTLASGRRAYGVLGGRRFSVTLATHASSGAAADWPWPAAGGRTIIP